MNNLPPDFFRKDLNFPINILVELTIIFFTTVAIRGLGDTCPLDFLFFIGYAYYFSVFYYSEK